MKHNLRLDYKDYLTEKEIEVIKGELESIEERHSALIEKVNEEIELRESEGVKKVGEYIVVKEETRLFSTTNNDVHQILQGKIYYNLVQELGFDRVILEISLKRYHKALAKAYTPDLVILNGSVVESFVELEVGRGFTTYTKNKIYECFDSIPELKSVYVVYWKKEDGVKHLELVVFRRATMAVICDKFNDESVAGDKVGSIISKTIKNGNTD